MSFKLVTPLKLIVASGSERGTGWMVDFLCWGAFLCWWVRHVGDLQCKVAAWDEGLSGLPDWFLSKLFWICE
jgi:hypothetical protein